MTPQKPWYTSKTIWYAILSGAGLIIASFITQYPDLAILATINSVIQIAIRLLSTPTSLTT